MRERRVKDVRLDRYVAKVAKTSPVGFTMHNSQGSGPHIVCANLYRQCIPRAILHSIPSTPLLSLVPRFYPFTATLRSSPY